MGGANDIVIPTLERISTNTEMQKHMAIHPKEGIQTLYNPTDCLVGAQGSQPPHSQAPRGHYLGLNMVNPLGSFESSREICQVHPFHPNFFISHGASIHSWLRMEHPPSRLDGWETRFVAPCPHWIGNMFGVYIEYPKRTFRTYRSLHSPQGPINGW